MPMAFLIVLMIGAALAVLFVGLRYKEAHARRQELERRGLVKAVKDEESNHLGK
jgi:hypothetical protein